MTGILEVLFNSIPFIVYEPVFITGCLGLAAAVFACRGRKSVLFLTIVSALIFMVLWRCAIQIVSSRYGAILIYPMIAAAAYFCFSSEKLAARLPFETEKFRRFLPGILLIALVLSCIGKDLNYNRYHGVMNAALAIRNDKVTGKKIAVCTDKGRKRQFLYYSKIPVDYPKKMFKKTKGNFSVTHYRELLKNALSKEFTVVYLCLSGRSDRPHLTAADMGLPEGSWSLLSEEYFNRKKKKSLRVYRYIHTSSGEK